MTVESQTPGPPEADRTVAIYRAAARIFHAKGYHATSINEIAEAVQLTKAGLYYYIKGKQELLFSIMLFAMDRLESQVIERARTEDDPEARLRSVIRNHARLITEDRSALTVLVNELEGLSEEHRAQIVERQRRYVAFVRETLLALRAEGRLADVDPTVASFGVLGAVLWVARWFRPKGRLSGEEVVHELENLILGGVLSATRQS